MQLTQLELIDEEDINQKLKIIHELLKNKKVLVAFSGGVDSSVLAFIAKQYCDEVLLIMQDGYSVGIGEVDYAKRMADLLDIKLEFIHYNEFEISEDYASNPADRCYYCKGLLHGFLEELRVKKQFDLVLNGTNSSDLDGHRPGFKAIKEQKAESPLVAAKLTKSEIRWIAKHNELPVWDKPATACLASRFETGTRITKSGLQRVAEAEHYIKTQLRVNVLRVRDNGVIARIEVGKDELEKISDQKSFQKVKIKLLNLGYKNVIIDKKGYRPAVPNRN